jgi:hypothetical protein
MVIHSETRCTVIVETIEDGTDDRPAAVAPATWCRSSSHSSDHQTEASRSNS